MRQKHLAKNDLYLVKSHKDKEKSETNAILEQIRPKKQGCKIGEDSAVECSHKDLAKNNDGLLNSQTLHHQVDYVLSLLFGDSDNQSQ